MVNIIESATLGILKKIYTLDQAKKVCRNLGLKFKYNDPWSVLLDNWDYPKILKITREIALSLGGKYDIQKFSDYKSWYTEEVNLYKSLFGETLDWRYHPSKSDTHRKKYTYRQMSLSESTLIYQQHIITGTIQSYKNDLLEFYLVLNNPNIFPTLKDSKGLDFFYKGHPYDWKTSQSLGKAFIEKQSRLGLDPIKVALTYPEEVAKSLYENQDSTRFGGESRHFIISWDAKIKTVDQLLNSFESISFENPMSINFTYNGQDYSTQALVSYI